MVQCVLRQSAGSWGDRHRQKHPRTLGSDRLACRSQVWLSRRPQLGEQRSRTRSPSRRYAIAASAVASASHGCTTLVTPSSVSAIDVAWAKKHGSRPRRLERDEAEAFVRRRVDHGGGALHQPGLLRLVDGGEHHDVLGVVVVLREPARLVAVGGAVRRRAGRRARAGPPSRGARAAPRARAGRTRGSCAGSRFPGRAGTARRSSRSACWRARAARAAPASADGRRRAERRVHALAIDERVGERVLGALARAEADQVGQRQTRRA